MFAEWPNSTYKVTFRKRQNISLPKIKDLDANDEIEITLSSLGNDISAQGYINIVEYHRDTN